MSPTEVVTSKGAEGGNNAAAVVASAPGVEAGSSELVKEMDSGVVGALTVSSSGGGGDVPVAYEAHAEEESHYRTEHCSGCAPP